MGRGWWWMVCGSLSLLLSGCLSACERAPSTAVSERVEGAKASTVHVGEASPAALGASSSPRGLENAPGALAWGEVTLPDRAHSPRWRVEIAREESERSRGLMYRRVLPEDQGMIFLMPYDHDWAFYMRNTYIPLDMIFIDRHWRVVGLQVNTRPLTESLRRVGAPSRFVLELAAHQARKHGIRVGTRLRFREDNQLVAPAAPATSTVTPPATSSEGP